LDTDLESVMPDLLDITPISNYTVFNRIFQDQNTEITACFITNKRVFVGAANRKISTIGSKFTE
jgi:hypothetical protein